MYSPTLGRFVSRDQVPADGIDVLYGDEWIAQSLRRMRNAYRYACDNPTNRVDPSGLVCRYADAPSNAIPEEDLYRPTRVWKPQPARGYVVAFRTGNRQIFQGVDCCYAPPGSALQCCKVDMEILARAYRYFRFSGDHFIGYSGQPIGVSNDPRDFFSLVVFTICYTNITCEGKRLPDSTDRLVTRPLQKDGRGVFIRQGEGDIETTLEKFETDEACTFAEDAATWLERKTQPGRIDPQLPQ